MILKENESRRKLLDGINKTADVVKSTLGYRGRTVMVASKFGLGFDVTKDGVSVAKAITLEDNVEDLGSDFVKNAAMKTVSEAGDNTTTTTILTQKICNMVNAEIELGANINDMVSDLKSDLNLVVDYIKSSSNKVTDVDSIHKVALVASNNDYTIADNIRDVYKEAGFNVQIDVVESDAIETSFEIVKGYTMPETGYASPIFVNNYEKGRVEYNNPRIFINNGKIRNISDALTDIISENTDRNNPNFRPLVIICEDIEDSALEQVYAAYKSEMIHEVCIVRSNLIYDDRKQVFVDASKVLGAGYNEDRFLDPGKCDKVIIEKDNITFINGSGNYSKYLKELKDQYESNKNEFLRKRIFSLESTAAIIKVGGKLSTEISEKKDRLEDAVFAVKSAIEEGYCPGGSSVYIFANRDLHLKTDILKESLLECYKQLMWNAGLEPMYYLREIHDKGRNTGFNLKTNEVEDMLEAGIYDSAKGLRVSLENAVHTACNFANINHVIY